MSNPVEKIAGVAVATIMLIITLFVLATLGGTDPSALGGFVETSVKLIIYAIFLGIFGAIVLSVLKGLEP